MAQFLYRIQPTRPGLLKEGPTPEEAAIVEEHFRYLKNLVEEGVVLLAGRTLVPDEKAFGVVVFAAASDQEAVALMRGDPAVANNVMTAELFPFRVVLGPAAGWQG